MIIMIGLSTVLAASSPMWFIRIGWIRVCVCVYFFLSFVRSLVSGRHEWNCSWIKQMVHFKSFYILKSTLDCKREPTTDSSFSFPFMQNIVSMFFFFIVFVVIFFFTILCFFELTSKMWLCFDIWRVLPTSEISC